MVLRLGVIMCTTEQTMTAHSLYTVNDVMYHVDLLAMQFNIFCVNSGQL